MVSVSTKSVNKNINIKNKLNLQQIAMIIASNYLLQIMHLCKPILAIYPMNARLLTSLTKTYICKTLLILHHDDFLLADM